jgi:hypothetical protein
MLLHNFEAVARATEGLDESTWSPRCDRVRAIFLPFGSPAFIFDAELNHQESVRILSRTEELVQCDWDPDCSPDCQFLDR